MKTVLLAEGHPATLEHVRAMLDQAGYRVRAAADFGSALEQFVAYRPEAVLVAVDFPAMEGQPLSLCIRATQQGKRIPIVILDRAHLGAARGVQAILDLHANAYVADPTRPAEVLGRLGPLLEAKVHHRHSPEAKSGGELVMARDPSTSGELSSRGMPALVLALLRTRRSGILVVSQRSVIRRLFLLGGEVAHFDSTRRTDWLTHHLEEQGLLTREQGDGVLASLQAGLRIGVALAEVGLELDEGGVRRVLEDYLFTQSAQLLGTRQGSYAFHDGSEFEPDVPALRVPVLKAMLAGVRRSYPLRDFAEPLQPYFDHFPVRTEAFAADFRALGLATAEIELALKLNGRIRLRQVLAHGRVGPAHNTSLMWFLTLLGDVAYLGRPQPEPGMDEAQVEELEPRRRKRLPAQTVAELREAAVRIVTGSYFQVLGLNLTADDPAVDAAYQAVSARFHADSYPEHDTSELQDLLESVQDKLAAAHRVLGTESKRRAYLEHLLSRGGGRLGAPNVDAELAIARADEALTRKDAITARGQYEVAVRLNPKEPEYYPRLAWATFVAGQGNAKERAQRALPLVKRALVIDPLLERAHVVAAILENASELTSPARRRLLEVLQRNPGSTLAKAALRQVGR